jgi:hypothetical protein
MSAPQLAVTRILRSAITLFIGVKLAILRPELIDVGLEDSKKISTLPWGTGMRAASTPRRYPSRSMKARVA